MPHTLIIISTCSAVTLLVVGVLSVLNDLFFRYRALVRNRLANQFFKQSNSNDSSQVFFDMSKLHDSSTDSSGEWSDQFQLWLDQSGTGIAPIRLLAFCGISGCVTGLLVVIAGFTWWISVGGVIAGATIPLIYVATVRKQRVSKLINQLPDAFEGMSRSVRSGHSVFSALQMIANEYDSPISDEFALCYEQQNLGMSVDASLRDLARRTGNMELQMFVVGIIVQIRSGGDLNELLETLAHTIRNRLKLASKIKAFTSEGRMQAMTLIVLPLAAFATLNIMAPDYIESLLKRPVLLTSTVMAQIAGAIWVRSIVKPEA